ncbi:MAG: acetyl-CoA C-acetyltransferase [bacterium]|nr:acetyl-CoA C-acetyltransferase [bacterium]
MADAYIIDAVRSPMGRFGGGLSHLHPADLGANILSGLIDRTGVDPGAVDDCIMGCVGQIGAQAFNVARNAWLSAGLPEHVPAVSIDRQCGSSQQAVHFAAQGVMSGTQDLVVAGGVEVMSLITLNSQGDVGPDLGMRYPFDGDGWAERFGDEEVHQFRGGNLIAERWDVTLEDMNSLALRSHQNAARAWEEGRFEREVQTVGECSRDEGIRPDTSMEKMAKLRPFSEHGPLTAANSSQITDGSAALLIASEKAVAEHGLTPRARVHTMAVVGSDPVLILTGPIPATTKVLERAGMGLDDIDLFECNEAFASVVLAWAKETGVDMDKVNVNGGAIALGHPLGASGARIMTTLLNELERSGGRYGLQTMCEGGGLANATIIENLAA